LERLVTKRTETGSCPSPSADGDYLCVHHLSFVHGDMDVLTVFTENSLNLLKSTIQHGEILRGQLLAVVKVKLIDSSTNIGSRSI
jgi:hypothetical protein